VTVPRSRAAPLQTTSVSNQIEQAAAILTAAAALGCEPRTLTHDFTPQSVEAALDAAQRQLAQRLAGNALPSHRTRLSVVLLATAELRTTIAYLDRLRRAAAFSTVTNLNQRLGSVATFEALLSEAPGEVCAAGYERCLVSTVDRGLWIARAAYVRGDPGLAQALVTAGSQPPRRIDATLLESEMLRRPVPLLVTDAQRNPNVHRELIRISGTRRYVAAPVVVTGNVAAFVHADMSRHTGSMDDFDRELLAVVAECLGFAFERTLYRQRLQTLKQSVGAYASTLLDMVDDVAASGPCEPWDALRADPDPCGPAASARLSSQDHYATPGLTRREREVLDRMAAGQRNTEIARALFIAEGTVKAHVKQIFRKLGVSTRAEAVSRHLRAR
jgi:DNA-binding CsgD family transcriptional regulator